MTSDSKKEKGHKEHLSTALTRLNAQRLEALGRNDTKTASLIQKIINLLTKK